MSSDDQFTSIQWDRDEFDKNDEHENIPGINPIAEEGSLNSDQQSNKTIEEKEHHEQDENITERLESTHINDVNDDDDDLPPKYEPVSVNDTPSQNEIKSPSETPQLQPTSPPPPVLPSHPPQQQQQQVSPKVVVSEPTPIHNEPVTVAEPAAEHQQHQEEEEEVVKPKGYIDISFYEKYSIESSVTHPNRDLDAASKPFISYLITTTTNNPAILKLTKEKKPKDNEEYLTFSVRRRYGDFRYLYESLSNDFPTVMIPPLPSKSNFKYLTGDTFSSEFVHKRLHSLDRFVRFILQHKILSQSSIFHLFISDSNDWATFAASLKLKDSTEESSGFVGKVVNEDLITETVMNLLTPSKHKKETNRDILEINDKLKKLYENLLKLDKIFSKLNKKNHELSVDYEHFSKQIIKLSTREDEEAIDSNYKIFAQCLTEFSKSWDSLYRFYNESFIVSFKDSGKYIMSLTNLIQIQHNKQIDLQVLQDYLNKTKAELISVGGNLHNVGPPPSPSRGHQTGGIINDTTQLIKDTLSTSATPHIGSTSSDNKIQKLENKIQELNKEIRKESELLTELINQIIVEFGNLQNFIKSELKNSMISLCDQNISFYQSLLQKYEEVELKLMKQKESL